MNEASARYGNNVSLNAQYIKKQMDYKYGDDEDENFYIFIQTREGQYTNGLLFHPTDKFILAGRAGINRQNHSWSYVFIRSLGTTSLEDYVPISYPTTGRGFNSTIKNMVISVINKY